MRKKWFFALQDANTTFYAGISKAGKVKLAKGIDGAEKYVNEKAAKERMEQLARVFIYFRIVEI